MIKIKKSILLSVYFLIIILSLSFTLADNETISYSNSSTSAHFVTSSANPDDGRILLTDPSYEYPDFYVWYGGNNKESVGNWSVYDYAIIKNNSDSSWISSVASKTKTFGYVYIGDYGISNTGNGWNRTVWVENKTNLINNWTDASSNINILFDLIGDINDTDNLFNTTLLNNLTNYVYNTKSRDTILNVNGSFDNLYNYSNSTLRSDICSTWNGASYVYKDISDDIAIANHYMSNNVTLFVSSLGNVTDYEKAYYCYMRNKVLFGDNLIYSYSQKNYSVDSQDMIDWNHFKYPNLGNSIDTNYSINGDVYSREFNNGVVSINITSNTVSYNTDYQIDYIQFCAYFEDRDDGASDEGLFGFNLNDKMLGGSWIPMTFYDSNLVQNVKTWKCKNLSTDYYEPSGFYELEFYYIDLDTNYLNNNGLYMYHGITTGSDRLSFYESILNGHPSNDETDYTSFERGDNWAVNFTIHRTLNTLNLTLNNPISNYNTSNNSIDFGATIISDSYASVNCNLSIDGIINESNQVFNNNTPKNITVSGFNQGTHLWNYTCWDSDNYAVNSNTRQFTIDSSSPQLNYYNSSTNTSYVGNTIYIWANFTEAITDISSVWLNVNGIVNTTNSSNNLNNSLVNFSYIIPNEMELTTINFTISANDSVGNLITTNILNVIVYDSTKPTIILNNPINNYNTSNQNITFNFSVIDADSNLNCNLTINGNINQTNISSDNETIFNHPNLFNEGSYLWNLTCWDSYGNTNNSETRTFNIDLTPPSAPLFTPDNITTTNDGTVNLTWSIVNDAVKYMIFRNTSNFTITDNSLWIANTTNNYYQDSTTLSGINYWYRIIAVDNVGNYNYSNSSLSQNITAVDTIKPNLPTVVNVTQSSNTATITWSNVLTDVEGNTDSSGLVYQIWTGTDINMSKSEINETLSFLKNVSATNSTTYSITSSSRYYFVVTTVDDAGNKNLSFSNNNMANVSLTYTAPSNPPSGGGGGGGSSSSVSGITYTIQLSKDTEIKKQLKKADKVNFNFKSESHSITLNNVYTNSVEVVVQSTPIFINVLIGETEKVDIDKDGIWDLSIKLNSISYGKADLSITQIEEEVPKQIVPEVATQNEVIEESIDNNTSETNDIVKVNEEEVIDNTQDDIDNIQVFNSNYQYFYLLVGIVFIILIIVFGVYYLKNKKHKKHKK